MWKVYNNEIKKTDLAELNNFLRENNTVGLDIETTGLNYLKEKITAIGIGNENEQFILTSNIKEAVESCLFSCTTVLHNAMFDLCFIAYQYKIPVSQADIIDTYQRELLLTNGVNVQRKYQTLVKKYLNEQVDKTEQKSFKSENLTESQILYLANDVKHLIPLANAQQKVLDEYVSIGALSYDLEINQNKIVADMADITVKGVKFDKKKHLILIDMWVDEEEKIIQSILKHIDYPINLNSPKQLVQLFSKYDNTLTKTSKAALEEYIMLGTNNELRALVKDLLSYRKLAKLLSTYGTKFLSRVHEDRIRTLISTNTLTGRFSSGDVSEQVGILSNGKPKYKNLNQFVNLQNIPSTKFKECFIPDEGEEMVTLDLDGCELRIIADQSRDPVLLAGVSKEIDLHSSLASISYGIIRNDSNLKITKGMPERQIHKPALFAMLYGAKPTRIAQVLNIPLSLAKTVWKALRNELHVAFDYLDSYVKTSLNNGFAVANNVSRKAFFLDEYLDYEENGLVYPKMHGLIKKLYNFPMQATNADMIKESIINLNDYFRRINGCNIRLSVYDEIVYTRPKGYAYIDEQVAKIVKKSCNKYLNTVQMELSINVENYWSK